MAHTLKKLISLLIILSFSFENAGIIYAGVSVSEDALRPLSAKNGTRALIETVFKIRSTPKQLFIPGIGQAKDTTAIIPLQRYNVPGQGLIKVGSNGVTAIGVNRSGEFVFISRKDVTEVMLLSKIGVNPPPL